MHFKTGKKDTITILLVGLCLNLSAFHFHSLLVYPDSDKGNIPHHIKEELPVCFACQHLTAGIQSYNSTSVITTESVRADLFSSVEAETDFTPASISNKSPPLE
ncbi:hypothetical protein G3570_05350 [Balneolaceae bacterium YR4-1]|uniref:Uncharacterized protein n=1 Tax=Halalkalibaculum roseum TaxID=2709311 RepID=A0A6M1T1Y2_9BACT|nr:hypothetical protein [Halalkalibaculum roseum]NGP76045.1 hypothetical protein [Halalkalibaculum roseum]